VATGTLVAESVAVGAALHGLDLVLREVERVEPADLSDGQRAAGIPARWTLLRFDMDDAKAGAFAEAHARKHGVPEPQIDWP
jgi:hypothetical protein